MNLIVLVSFVMFLSACGDASTVDTLPVGTAPNEVTQASSENTTPYDSSEQTPTDPVAADPEPEVETPAPAPTPVEKIERQSVAGMSYVLPDGWSVGPARQMRLLTLLPDAFDGAELAISRWPSDVGGFKANVGRWAMQAGIDHDVQDRKAYPQIDVGGTQSAYLPLVNKDTNKAILAIWVPRGDNPDQPDETWTFKLTCSAEQAIKLEPIFKAWAGSVTFE